MFDNHIINEGREAYKSGKKKADCPYSEGNCRESWRHGWNEERAGELADEYDEKVWEKYQKPEIKREERPNETRS
jgi:ribosome modulation factor